MKKKYNIIYITSELTKKNYSVSTLIIYLINKLSKHTNSKIFVEDAELKTSLVSSSWSDEVGG